LKTQTDSAAGSPVLIFGNEFRKDSTGIFERGRFEAKPSESPCFGFGRIPKVRAELFPRHLLSDAFSFPEIVFPAKQVYITF